MVAASGVVQVSKPRPTPFVTSTGSNGGGGAGVTGVSGVDGTPEVCRVCGVSGVEGVGGAHGVGGLAGAGGVFWVAGASGVDGGAGPACARSNVTECAAPVPRIVLISSWSLPYVAMTSTPAAESATRYW